VHCIKVLIFVALGNHQVSGIRAEVSHLWSLPTREDGELRARC
jgi:hypothetical protein